MNPTTLDSIILHDALEEVPEAAVAPAVDVRLEACESRHADTPDPAGEPERMLHPVPLQRTGFAGPLAELEAFVRERICGQDHVVDALLAALSKSVAGLNDPGRPLLTGLLLGPTGVGKTEVARVLAEGLFGRRVSMVRVDCEEYSHGFELSKLLGAPPGYVGFQVEPLLSQQRLESAHRQLRESGGLEQSPRLTGLADAVFGADRDPVSLILFDEVEKASPKVWNALLGLLDDGRLTLGDNSTTSFGRSIVLMTSNVGSRSLSGHLEGAALGFERSVGAAPTSLDARALRALALDEARRHFPAEFLNRADLQLAFDPLDDDSLGQICDRLLTELQQRILDAASIPILIRVDGPARSWLVEQGSDPRYGARPLRRVIETELVSPLSDFIAAGALERGDVVEIGTEGDGLAFQRAPRGRDELVTSGP